MKKVYLGVGHGGSDPGAVANGFKEKDLTLAIALACRDELVRYGVEVLMSRTTDIDGSVNRKVTECDAFGADLGADIHINAGGGDGSEVFHTKYFGTGNTLAKNIIAEIQAIGQNTRGTKVKLNQRGNDYFGFIRMTKCPAVLVECAFIDTKDIEIIDTAAEQKAMGIAIAKGILKTLGVSTVVVTTKSIDEIADEVLAGKWGNGDARKQALIKAGYDYTAVQSKVNEKLTGTKTQSKKSIDEIAREVIAGKWGNGNARKKALVNAGYDYKAVQKRVNELI